MPTRLSELASRAGAEGGAAGRKGIPQPTQRAGLSRGCRRFSAWGGGEPSDPEGSACGAAAGGGDGGGGFQRRRALPPPPPSLGAAAAGLPTPWLGRAPLPAGGGRAAARGGGDYSPPGPRPRPHTWAETPRCRSAGAGRLAPREGLAEAPAAPVGGLHARQVLTAVGCQVSASFPAVRSPHSLGYRPSSTGGCRNSFCLGKWEGNPGDVA